MLCSVVAEEHGQSETDIPDGQDGSTDVTGHYHRNARSA